MDANRFESLLRSLAQSPTRREATRLLAGSVLGSVLTLGARPMEAKKRGKGKKKKKKRGGRRSPPPTPVPVLIYQCPGPGGGNVNADGTRRVAQTFTAPLSGSLLQIQFEVLKGGDTTGDVVVQLLATANDVPTNTVLAEVSIPNDAVPVGQSTLMATFSGPPLVAATRYAAAISQPGGDGFLAFNRIGNPCPGSHFNQDPSGVGAFTEALGSSDLVTSVTVLV